MQPCSRIYYSHVS